MRHDAKESTTPGARDHCEYFPDVVDSRLGLPIFTAECHCIPGLLKTWCNSTKRGRHFHAGFVLSVFIFA
jgi:hypothetical protein